MMDFSTIYPIIADCIVKAIEIVLTYVVCKVIIPWIKNEAIPWLKEKRLYNFICKAVRAAEKMCDSGEIQKGKKLDWVIKVLKARGVEITPEVRAMIESAVGNLDDAFSGSIVSMIEALLSGEADANILVSNGKIVGVEIEDSKETTDQAE